MAYTIYIMSSLWVSRFGYTWDLRWIMTEALLRDTRSFSYRSVAILQYTFRLLVKCLWTPEGFQAPNAIHQTLFLDLRQLTLGIGKFVNRCFADLEVYMPNDQS